jgi:hypothetical protein
MLLKNMTTWDCRNRRRSRVEEIFCSHNRTQNDIKDPQISSKILSRTIPSSSTQTVLKILNKFNMFARATPAFVLALPVLAAASVLPRTGGGGDGGSNQCNTGSTYCCNSAVSVSNYFFSSTPH